VANLNEITNYCNRRTNSAEIKDFPGACNGLQVENKGEIRKIGAAVDAGLVPFRLAIEEDVDLLIVHHGLFWSPLQPITESNYQKVATLLEGNLALYSSHLPLDCHPEIGNNYLLARLLDLEPEETFLPFEGVDIGLITLGINRENLKERLIESFNGKITSIEFGKKKPERIAILTGSGASAIKELRNNGIDTLITGELRQNHFNQAQEEGLNIYLCGHYATEVFGVCALAEEISQRFKIPWTFLSTDCPL
jgi:dinuclear metal center YbgI/SA1388 family protein